jgi:rhodanese-related sulfurtransferase
MKKTFVPLITLTLFLFVSFELPADSLSKGGIFETISPHQATKLISQRKDDPRFIILDVRTPAEYKGGHIKNAVLLDYYSKTFVVGLKSLDKAKTYLVYCRSGNRSQKTLLLMKNMAFQEVYNMGQGIAGWRFYGFRLEK